MPSSLLGGLLRFQMGKKGMSVAAAAELCGVSPATVRDWLSGRIAQPGGLEKLAETLGLPLELLRSLSQRHREIPSRRRGEVLADPAGPYRWYAWDLEEAVSWLEDNVENPQTEAEELPNFYSFEQAPAEEGEPLADSWQGPEEESEEGRPVLFVLFADDSPRAGEVHAIKFYHGGADAQEVQDVADSARNDPLAIVHGYAAVFNEEDERGEIIRHGAFRERLRQGLPVWFEHDYVLESAGQALIDGIPVPFQFRTRNPTAIPIGGTILLEEDRYGLWYEAGIADTARNRDLVATWPHVGFQTSIGFDDVPGGARALDPYRIELLALALKEISVVTWPRQTKTTAELGAAGPAGRVLADLSRLAQAM